MIISSFKSDRKFSIFSYEVGHGLLLLRSGKTNEHHTRIDVLVKDVRAMEIRSWFEGFEIAEEDREYLREFRSNPIEMIEPGNRVYALGEEGGKDLSLVESFSPRKMTVSTWTGALFLVQRCRREVSGVIGALLE
jgi:hypothetical protein